MQYRKLANTDVEISQIVLGCWALGGGYTWGDQDDQTSIQTVDAALDMGITCFDTAEFYGEGRSESILGRALTGKRKDAVIISKVWTENMHRDGVIRACEGSLRRLNTDHIDLYMIHWANRSVALAETLEAMSSLKQSGKVRAVGVCNFGANDLAAANEVTDIAAEQLPYSLLFRAIEFEVLPACIRQQVPVMAYSPLSQGLLTGKFTSPEDVDDERARTRFYSKNRPGTVHDEDGYEDKVFAALAQLETLCRLSGISMSHAAINWVLQQNGVCAALVGARTPEQVRDNARFRDGGLETEVLCPWESATAALKTAMGPNPDMWRTESRFR